jgi:subtilisin family serine protease
VGRIARKSLLGILALGLLSTAVALPEPVPSQNPEKADIDPKLKSSGLSAFSTQSTSTQEVIVEFENYPSKVTEISEMKDQASQSRRPLLKLADKSSAVEIKNKFWITNAVLVEKRRGISLTDLASVEGVRELNANSRVQALDSQTGSSISSSDVSSSDFGGITSGLDMIDAPEAWSEFSTQGGGVDVAVLDTGVDPDHPDIEASFSSSNWAEFDRYGERKYTSPMDYGSHGTHVSGTVVGGDASGEYIGVSPDADLYHGAVLTDCPDSCGGSGAQIIAGIEWAVDNNVEVISLSLGGPDYIEEFIESVRNAQSNGILVVAATGNDPNNNGEGKSSSPGNVYESFAVGAVDSNEDVPEFSKGEEVDTSEDWGTDAPLDWPSTYMVPDVVAPGVDVKSSVPGGGYSDKSGTSMATPHVSGVAALVESSVSEDLSPEQLKTSIASTTFKDGQDNRYGDGIVDAYAAVNYAIDNYGEPDTLNVTDITTDAGDQASITVEPVKSYGERIERSGLPISVADADGVADLQGASSETNSTGFATFTFNETDSANYSVKFEYSGDQSVTGTSQVEIDPAEPSELNFVNQPSNTVVKQPVEDDSGSLIKVEALDQFNNPVNSFSSDIALSLNDSSNSVTNTATEGVAEYPDYTVSDPGFYTLNATSSDLENAVSQSFEVVSDKAENIMIETQPGETVAGSEIAGPPRVKLTDEFGNPVKGAELSGAILGEVQASFSSETNNEGIFEMDVALSKKGSYKINFTINSLDQNIAANNYTVSNEFKVTGAEASKLNISKVKRPLNVSENAEFKVSALDKFDNPTENHSELTYILSFSRGSLNDSDSISDSGTSRYFSWDINKSGNYTLETNSSLEEDSIEVEFRPGSAEKLNITSVKETPRIGENFSIKVWALDKYENNALNFSESADASLNISNAEIQNSDIEFEDGLAQEELEIDSSETGKVNLTIKNSSIGLENDSTILNLKKPDRPEIESINLDKRLVSPGENITARINVSAYNYNENDESVDLSFDNSTLDKNTGGSSDYNSTFEVNETGNYSFEASVTDIFDQENSSNKSVEVENSSNISIKADLDEGDSKPKIDVVSPFGKLRNSSEEGQINMSIPQSDSWKVEISVNDTEVALKDVNFTGKNVSAKTNLDIVESPEHSIQDFSGSKTVGLNTSLDYRSGNVRPGISSYDSVYKCGDWSFESDICSSDWSLVSDPGGSSLGVTSFSAYTFGNETQPEEDGSEDDTGGGGGGGDPAGGGLAGGFSASSESEPEVVQTEEGIEIEFGEGDHQVDFNSSVPLASIEFTSDKNGRISLKSRNLREFSSGFKASTNLSEIEANYTIEDGLSGGLYRRSDGEWISSDLTLSEQSRTYGVDFNSCYRDKNISASSQNSCSLYTNECMVPESAEIVESCQAFNKSQRLLDELEKINDSIGSDRAREIRQSIDAGNFSKAEKLLTSKKDNVGLTDFLPLDFGYVIGFVLLAAAVPPSAYLVQVFRKKRAMKRLNGLIGRTQSERHKGLDKREMSEKLEHSDTAIMNGNYLRAEKLMDEAEEMLEE